MEAKRVLNTRFQEKQIWRFIKRKMNFSFKRGLARISKKNINKSKFIQAIFSVIMLPSFLYSVLTINVDETNF